MMSRPGIGLVLLGLSFLDGCSRGPDIQYRHLSDSELVQQSPIVVVGPVNRQEMFSNERKRYGVENGRPLSWHPVNVRITVESVLRGELSSPTVEYTYWIPDGPKVGEWNHPADGLRYVHFLRRAGGRLRAVVDFWPSSIQLTTGRHRPTPETNGVAQTIAQWLLMPGDEFALDRFNPDVGYAHAWALAGRPAANVLIEKLALNSDPQIRKAACEILADSGVRSIPRCSP
jgi:hypothetical protein